MTSFKVAANAALTRASSTRSLPEPNERPAEGWDPYEVWRTRVLMPRLAGQKSVIDETTESALPLARSA